MNKYFTSGKMLKCAENIFHLVLVLNVVSFENWRTHGHICNMCVSSKRKNQDVKNGFNWNWIELYVWAKVQMQMHTQMKLEPPLFLSIVKWLLQRMILSMVPSVTDIRIRQYKSSLFSMFGIICELHRYQELHLGIKDMVFLPPCQLIFLTQKL